MILVKFEETIQVNDNEWRNVWREKIFNEYTTLNEVLAWAKGIQNENKLGLRGLIITEIES